MQTNDLLLQYWATNPSVKSIAEKIRKIMKDVEFLLKDGENSFQRYNYVSEANTVATIRKSWIEHGLTAIPFIEDIKFERVADTNKGSAQYMTTVVMLYQLLDPDSGEFMLARFVGQGIDSGDKGVYKAITGANKYFLFKTFQIETTDEAPPASIDPEKPNDVDQAHPVAKQNANAYAKKSAPKNSGNGNGNDKDKNPFKWNIKSKFKSTCQVCLTEISIGENIACDMNDRKGHPNCLMQ